MTALPNDIPLCKPEPNISSKFYLLFIMALLKIITHYSYLILTSLSIIPFCSFTLLFQVAHPGGLEMYFVVDIV